MKALSQQQLLIITQFIQVNHAFGRMRRTDKILTTDTGFRHHHNIRYINSHYDTLSQDIWCVELIGLGFKHRFANNSDAEDLQYETLYDWIMGFLKGEWVPEEDKTKTESKDNTARKPAFYP